ncbi:MAG: hypothetical protein J0I06_20095 [Planctomycetes bacterium]|nr:hypothetical protein [Planctomycetota bacterium]
MTPAVIVPILFCLIVVIAVVTAIRDRATFDERFPPISDAEFLARCSPGVSPEVALKVRQIVAHHFAIEYERVHPSMSFVDDIGAD